MATKNLTPFETIASYVTKSCPRAFGTVVLSNGARLAATDGFGLVAVPSDRPAGAYRPSGEPSEVRAPDFGAVLDSALAEPGREVQVDAEGLAEVLAGVSKSSKLFVGIGRHAPDLIVLTARPTNHGFGARVWFGAAVLKQWVPKLDSAAAVRVTDDKLVVTLDNFTHLVVGVVAPG